MQTLPSIMDISQVIQLSVAPVFLLVFIAGFLNALVSRLSRVVDRSRHLEAVLQEADGKVGKDSLRELYLEPEILALWERPALCSY